MRRRDGDEALEREDVRNRGRRKVPAVEPGSLAWASAVGDQAVQRIARDRMIAREAEEELLEAEPSTDVEAGAPPAIAEGLGAEQLAALDGLPDEGEPLV